MKTKWIDDYPRSDQIQFYPAGWMRFVAVMYLKSRLTNGLK